MNFRHWFHHLFNPHCSQCKLDSMCQNCELIADLLHKEREYNRFLIEKLTEKVQVNTAPVESYEELKPIGGVLNWNQKRRELEMKARAESEKKVSIEEYKSTNDKLEALVLGDN